MNSWVLISRRSRATVMWSFSARKYSNSRSVVSIVRYAAFLGTFSKTGKGANSVGDLPDVAGLAVLLPLLHAADAQLRLDHAAGQIAAFDQCAVVGALAVEQQLEPAQAADQIGRAHV